MVTHPPSSTGSSIVFDRAVGYYDLTRGFPAGVEHQAAELFIKAGSLSQASRVLEVGVGTGRIALPLAPHVGVVHGVDLSRPMMGRLREKRTSEPITLTEGNALQLPFGSSSFDAVVIVHVLHLIPQWQAVLGEIARVLRPGGLLLAGAGGGSTHSDVWQPLWDAFNSVVPASDTQRVGMTGWAEVELPALGWRIVGEKHQITYEFERPPRHFLDGIRNRIWSGMWRLSDEDLTRAYEITFEVARAHFGDLDKPITMEGDFLVHAFLPPDRVSA